MISSLDIKAPWLLSVWHMVRRFDINCAELQVKALKVKDIGRQFTSNSKTEILTRKEFT